MDDYPSRPVHDPLDAFLAATCGSTPEEVRALIALDEVALRLDYIGEEMDVMADWQRVWIERRVALRKRQRGQRAAAAQWERACALWEQARVEGRTDAARP